MRVAFFDVLLTYREACLSFAPCIEMLIIVLPFNLRIFVFEWLIHAFID